MILKEYELELKPNFKRISFLLFLVFMSSNAQELSLEKAHQLMLSNNGDLKASHQEVNAKKEEQKAIKGLRYPSVSVSGTYVHLEKDISVNLNEQRAMVSGLISLPDPTILGDWNFTVLEQNLGMASADIEWPIFAGGKINAANIIQILLNSKLSFNVLLQQLFSQKNLMTKM